MMRDPYEILGVTKKATEAEIKKAFRTLAKKHHPDTHANDPKAVKKFQEISAAYEIVGDKEKRAQFDRGEIDGAGQPKGFNQGFHPGGGAGGFEQGFEGFRSRGGGTGGAGPQGFEFQWSGADGSEGLKADDIFADLLGGLGRGGRRRAQPRKGPDVQLETTVSLTEAALGGTRRVVLADGRQLEARIPPGVKDGQQIRLKGQGAPGESGGPPGDAFITIHIAPHPFLERDGLDLRMDLPVTLKEAILGAKIPVPTLTSSVTLTIPPHSNSGRTLRLKGKGLPGAGGESAGDLYVRLIVTLPEPADPKLDEFVKNWGNDYDPRAKLKIVP
ncbi:MAG TPA: J domain-containing protein [Micropepsaceae bacterium]|nr:J domain-containing protein [Micropepsaceae bacterium]